MVSFLCSPLLASINFDIPFAKFDESAGVAVVTLINIGFGNGTIGEYHISKVQNQVNDIDWCLLVRAPQEIRDQKCCSWCLPLYVSAPLESDITDLLAVIHGIFIMCCL